MRDCTCAGWNFSNGEWGACAFEPLRETLAELVLSDVLLLNFSVGDLMRVNKPKNTFGDYANLTYREWVRYNGALGWIVEVFDDPTAVPRGYAVMEFDDTLETMPIPLTCLEHIT